MKLLSTLFLLIFLSAGCTALTGPGDYSEYTAALSSHSNSETVRVTNQANAIKELTSSQSETKTEEALKQVIGAVMISQLKPISLDIKKPTTGMDVAKDLVGQIPFVATVAGMYKLGEAGIKNAGSTTIGDNSTVSDSFNPIENHATGNNTTATTTGTSTPTVVDPVIVDPVIVQPTVQ